MAPFWNLLIVAGDNIVPKINYPGFNINQICDFVEMTRPDGVIWMEEVTSGDLFPHLNYLFSVVAESNLYFLYLSQFFAMFLFEV